MRSTYWMLSSFTKYFWLVITLCLGLNTPRLFGSVGLCCSMPLLLILQSRWIKCSYSLKQLHSTSFAESSATTLVRVKGRGSWCHGCRGRCGARGGHTKASEDHSPASLTLSPPPPPLSASFLWLTPYSAPQLTSSNRGLGGCLRAEGAASESSSNPSLSLLYPLKALLYVACFFLGSWSFSVIVQSAAPLQWNLEEVCLPIKWKGLFVRFLILKSVAFTSNRCVAPALVQLLIFVQKIKANKKLFYLEKGLYMLNTAF